MLCYLLGPVHEGLSECESWHCHRLCSWLLITSITFEITKQLLQLVKMSSLMFTLVLTSKHPDFPKSQIFFDTQCICAVDANQVAIQFMWARDICLDIIKIIELLVTDVVIFQLTTFANANLEIVHPYSCKWHPRLSHNMYSRCIYQSICCGIRNLMWRV